MWRGGHHRTSRIYSLSSRSTRESIQLSGALRCKRRWVCYVTTACDPTQRPWNAPSRRSSLDQVNREIVKRARVTLTTVALHLLPPNTTNGKLGVLQCHRIAGSRGGSMTVVADGHWHGLSQYGLSVCPPGSPPGPVHTPSRMTPISGSVP